jgi:hypothetical protein
MRQKNMAIETKKESTQQMSPEDRLDAVLYQFITLYERWSEDRQVAVKQGADAAKLVKEFTAQIESLKGLEPAIRKDLAGNIEEAFLKVQDKVSEVVSKASVKRMDESFKELERIFRDVAQQLKHQKEAVQLRYGFWQTVIIAISGSIMASLFLVWLLIPQPTLPLTNKQISELKVGHILGNAWTKLDKAEQDRIIELAKPDNKGTNNISG